MIPQEFAKTMVELNGEEGEQWLARLPSVIASCARRWSLTVLPPFEPLSYNYAAPARRSDGAGVVLKIGFPDPELLTEIDALRLFDGRGIVKLLEADKEQGAMLLEYINPGAPLTSVGDDQQETSIAAQVMRSLWVPAPAEHSFPTVAKWAAGLERLRQRFKGGVGPFPLTLVERAESLFADLIPSMEDEMLLHGDLHHHNILSAERRPWLALDPKGLIGEPAYEVGALLRNPMPQIVQDPGAPRILARRVDQLAEELGFDRERILGWGIAQAVLSAWWSLEDHGRGWELAMACAEMLAGITNYS